MTRIKRLATTEVARRGNSDETQRKIRYGVSAHMLQDVHNAGAGNDYSYGASNLDKCSGTALHYISEGRSSCPTQYPGHRHGFCPPQRELVLSGAQRAPGRKSTAAASGPTWRKRPHHRRCRQGSFQKTSLHRSQLAHPPRTV